VQQAETVAMDVERKAQFRQLLRDMRYLTRCMRLRHAAWGKGLGVDWDVAYHTMWNCERRLRQRYDNEQFFRMKGVVVRTYRVRSI